MSVFYPGTPFQRRLLALLVFAASVCIVLPLPAQEAPREGTENPATELDEFERIYGEGRNEEWGSGEHVRGRQYWFEFQRRFPYAVIPAGAREAAIARMNHVRDRLAEGAAKQGRSLFSANQWTQIGPYDVGGRVRAIAVHPTVPEIMYVGGASGGVWKTTDAGSTWTTTFDKQTALTIGAIGLDPNNPNVVYVGSGELRVASDVGYMADGLFKSTDGGATWRNMGLNNVVAISKVFVNSKNSNIVYVTGGRVVSGGRYTGGGLGTADGFYRSTDGGVSWVQEQPGAMLEMAVNPENHDEVLISSNNAIFRSTDAGANFTKHVAGINNLTRSLRMSMAHDPVDPSIVHMLQAYVSTSGTGTHVANLYKSTDGGVNWTFIKALDANFFRNQGEYNNCIAVDPNNPNNILAGGIDLWQSTDGGANWVNISRTFGSTFNEENAHPDHHIFAFDPTTPGLVYVGNDGGVYHSFNSGATWDRLTNSLPITQFHAIEIDQTRPFRVFGGTQDNQSQAGLGTTGHATEWTRLLGGDGFWVVVDLTNPDIIYAESQYGNVRRMNLNSLSAKFDIAQQINTDAGGWSTPMAMSPVDFSFWTARSNVYRTPDPRASTVSWTTFTPGYGGGKATALALHPTDAQRVIVGSGSGDVRFTTNGGANWTRSTGLPSRFLTDLMYDPQVNGRVWAVFAGFKAGHVFRSDDGGTSFTDVTSTLPDVPANAIEIDPTNSRHVFIGTDIGVFVSVDAGDSWFPFNEGMPVAPVVDMRIHRTRRMLIAATHGRSVFEAPIDNITVPATIVAPLAGATVGTPGALTVRWAGFEGPVNVFFSPRAGADFALAAANVSGATTTIQVPMARSTSARVKVEAVGGGRSATSEPFTLTATANVDALGKRGFAAEGIAVRNGQIWATARDSDTIYRLRLPLLGSAGSVVRSGFSGTVRDLAYDAEFDQFYALVTAADHTSPRLYKVDTTGAATAELPLPASVTTAVGVAIGPDGLVIAPAGAGGSLTIIDAMTGAEVRRVPFTGDFGAYRRGLVWNGSTYTQGVFVEGLDFPSTIQQLSTSDSTRLYEALPVVLSSGQTLVFYDLAIDPDGTSGETMYYATDTAGNIFRFRGALFAAVDGEDRWEGQGRSAITAVAPNPLRDGGTVDLQLESGGRVTIELITPSGARAAQVFNGPLTPGSHTLPIDTRLVPSGVYYVALVEQSGRRSVAPVVVVK